MAHHFLSMDIYGIHIEQLDFALFAEMVLKSDPIHFEVKVHPQNHLKVQTTLQNTPAAQIIDCCRKRVVHQVLHKGKMIKVLVNELRPVSVRPRPRSKWKELKFDGRSEQKEEKFDGRHTGTVLPSTLLERIQKMEPPNRTLQDILDHDQQDENESDNLLDLGKLFQIFVDIGIPTRKVRERPVPDDVKEYIEAKKCRFEARQAKKMISTHQPKAKAKMNKSENSKFSDSSSDGSLGVSAESFFLDHDNTAQPKTNNENTIEVEEGKNDSEPSNKMGDEAASQSEITRIIAVSPDSPINHYDARIAEQRANENVHVSFFDCQLLIRRLLLLQNKCDEEDIKLLGLAETLAAARLLGLPSPPPLPARRPRRGGGGGGGRASAAGAAGEEEGGAAAAAAANWARLLARATALTDPSAVSFHAFLQLYTFFMVDCSIQKNA